MCGLWSVQRGFVMVHTAGRCGRCGVFTDPIVVVAVVVSSSWCLLKGSQSSSQAYRLHLYSWLATCECGCALSFSDWSKRVATMCSVWSVNTAWMSALYNKKEQQRKDFVYISTTVSWQSVHRDYTQLVLLLVLLLQTAL